MKRERERERERETLFGLDDTLRNCKETGRGEQLRERKERE